MRINISSYVNSKSSNYGVNSLLVEIGQLDLYFSYRTVVAFRTAATGLVVSDNQWGPTTGKHLNAIESNHDVRVSRSEFEEQLETVLKAFGVNETPSIGV